MILKYAKKADLVIHAGDIGDIKVLDELSKVSNLRAVYGNIDSAEIRSCTNENEYLNIEGFKIFVTHIAGKQPFYNKRVRNLIKKEYPEFYEPLSKEDKSFLDKCSLGKQKDSFSKRYLVCLIECILRMTGNLIQNDLIFVKYY